MIISPGLRGGNRLAGGSLLTVAAILVRIQVEREGGDYVLVCFNIFTLYKKERSYAPENY